MGGTLSGEHGIGLVQKDFMDIAFSPDELSILKMIKNGFDPKGIMNPGKNVSKLVNVNILILSASKV